MDFSKKQNNFKTPLWIPVNTIIFSKTNKKNHPKQRISFRAKVGGSVLLLY